MVTCQVPPAQPPVVGSGAQDPIATEPGSYRLNMQHMAARIAFASFMMFSCNAVHSSQAGMAEIVPVGAHLITPRSNTIPHTIGPHPVHTFIVPGRGNAVLDEKMYAAGTRARPNKHRSSNTEGSIEASSPDLKQHSDGRVPPSSIVGRPCS